MLLKKIFFLIFLNLKHAKNILSILFFSQNLCIFHIILTLFICIYNYKNEILYSSKVTQNFKKGKSLKHYLKLNKNIILLFSIFKYMNNPTSKANI